MAVGMTVLNRKRGAIKGKITRLTSFMSSEGMEDTDVIELQIKLDAVKELTTLLDELKNSYFITASEEELEEQETVWVEMEEDLEKLKVGFERFKFKLLSADKEKVIDMRNSSQNPNVKLPDIPLPEFSGRYEDFNQFKIQFFNIIGNNTELSDYQKLYYLQAALKGEAKQIETSDDSYESLVKALEARFGNKGLIVNSHFNAILGFDKLSHESAKNLRTLVDNCQKNIRALKLMELELNKFSEILLINIVLQKLDKESRKHYELSLTSNELPDWNKFIEFLRKRSQVLENIEKCSVVSIKPKMPTIHYSKSRTLMTKVNNSPMCPIHKNEPHAIYKCDTFLKGNPLQRFDMVKKYFLCINCLSDRHKLTACQSKYRCSICDLKHNTLLHREQEIAHSNGVKPSPKQGLVSVPVSETTDAANDINSSLSSCLLTKGKSVLLSSAIVWVINSSGKFESARCVLDSGSQSNFMTLDFANRLALTKRVINAPVSSLGGNITTIKSQVEACISNGNRSFSACLKFLIVSKITDMVPANKLNLNNIELPNNCLLADPNFNSPRKVDLLLGNEIFFDCIKSGKIKTSLSNLKFQETVFGYVASGSVQTNQSPTYCGFSTQFDNIDDSLEKFWQLEEINVKERIVSKEAEYCEEHYKATHKRDGQGRYIVQMPFKEDLHLLGDSKRTAETRLKQLDQRLSKNAQMHELYREFMHEYETLDHMERVVEETIPDDHYYLPHHGVYRPDKLTTKLRVVFNASSPTSTGKSLNDLLLKGDVVEDIFNIMLRFRTHKFAFTADIEKMFRQILIDPSQRDFLRILWCNQPNEKPTTYRLKTVTYGTASAPFLAIRTLKQLALDESSNFPLASEISQRDFYMDDILSGAEDLRTARELQYQLQALLQKGGMKLHKWTSNSPSLLNSSSTLDHECRFPVDQHSTIKALGMNWNSRKDHFLFKVDLKDEPFYTKRSVLSVIARLYDPLGLLGPIVCKAKVFLQKLWLQKLNWEDLLPQSLALEWQHMVTSLKTIEGIRISRWILTDGLQTTVLHCFADASEAAYGAAVYLQCLSQNTSSAKLVSSKSRVAPLKTVSIPRLELCACLLASELMRKVKKSLNISLDRVILYSDSTISLAWIRTPPHKLKSFVANRVTKIQQLTQDCIWSHVPSSANPADILSRGAHPQDLSSQTLWWDGPPFLQEPAIVKADEIVDSPSDVQYIRELKITAEMNLVTFEIDFINSFLTLSNNYTKLINIFSYVFRFIGNCRTKDRQVGPLTVAEVTKSEIALISIIQRHSLPQDFKRLIKDKEVTKGSNLKYLSPFIDESQVIRVGGRLREANLPYNHRHPIVLPGNHRISYLIMLDHHISHCHIGAQSLLHCVRHRFWPIGGRNLARKIIHECVICAKNKPSLSEQKMGNLPKERLSLSFPFNNTGVDFCGPFFIKYKNQRKGALHKIYVAIFVCFATRAVHLELVSDLTSDSFIASLKRFISRRGKIASIFTDNARNFVGANNELKRLYNLIKYPDDIVAKYLSSERISWKFIPPRAPHFGGLWEAGVKSFKFHLKRAMGKLRFTFEEFLTITTQIEGILNSRPITPISTDANELEALTPAHFLIGRPVTTIVEQDLTDFSDNALKRWQRTTKVTQYLWKRWQRDYLSHLQQRSKWCFSKNNVEPGNLVVVKEDNMPITTWLLGKIETVIYGPDKKVRVCLVKTKSGILKRPITKLAVLPVSIVNQQV